MQQEDDWQFTVKLLQKAFEEDVPFDILKLFLTLDEQNSIKTRVKIVKLLLAGDINQRELSKQLGIGIGTVTRGSNSLKSASPEVIQWLQDNLLGKNS